MLVVDCAYPVGPWIYNPFKRCAEGLEDWNLIQSSIHMCVEHAFRILKGKWCIIMRKVDKPLRHIVDVVATCIIHVDFSSTNFFLGSLGLHLLV